MALILAHAAAAMKDISSSRRDVPLDAWLESTWLMDYAQAAARIAIPVTAARNASPALQAISSAKMPAWQAAHQEPTEPLAFVPLAIPLALFAKTPLKPNARNALKDSTLILPHALISVEAGSSRITECANLALPPALIAKVALNACLAADHFCSREAFANRTAMMAFMRPMQFVFNAPAVALNAHRPMFARAALMLIFLRLANAHPDASMDITFRMENATSVIPHA